MENVNVLPSPASSPSPQTLDVAVQPSLSDDVPSDIRSPRTDTMSNLSLSDFGQDIDAYMSEQGEFDTPSAILASSDATIHQSSPPAERLSTIMSKKQRQMEIGDTWYLIAHDWWKRWYKACTGQADKEGPVGEHELGPVNNASLLDEYGNLRRGVVEGVDMEYVPEDAWLSFSSWYGAATYPLPRQVVGRGESKQTSVELFPPHFLVAQLVPEGQEMLGSNPYPPLVLSVGETVATLHGKLADAILPNAQNRPIFRVWCLDTLADNHFDSVHVSPRSIDGRARLLEPRSVTLEEGGIESGDAFVVEFMDQGQRWLVDGTADKAKMQQRDVPPIFNSSDGFFNRMSSASPMATRSITAQTALKAIGNTISRQSLTSLSTALKPIVPGTLGLGNMGNTCFMNSALQCLAHSKELTEYFLSGVYEEELNPDNPLGMHGAIAEIFGSLLQKIWAPSSTSTSYSPREFKQQLQRFAPQFSGYQQHDSQELVAFLLDGLHEDLNRVFKKPYVEKPDWEGGGDLELVQLANKSWEGYKRRNDSVIVDLFQGQYQSTLVCPECKKISITFDPFMYLTLPLPVKKKWRHSIRYVPWDSEKPHLKIPIEIDSDATFKEVRSLLGRWLNVPAENLLTLEVFGHRFYKNLDDQISVGEMSDNDVIFCYELPCPAQQSRSYKPQPDDPLILPVYTSESNPPNRAFASTRSVTLIGTPIIAVFSQEEASDPSVIYDRVIERLHRWTRNSKFLYNWEATAASDIHKQSDDTLTTADQPIPDEGDIADQKMTTVDEDAILPASPGDSLPVRVGTRKDIFAFKIQYGQKQWGTTHDFYSSSKWESWKDRTTDAGEGRPILLKDDALICEFDENIKTFYFGDSRSQWDNSLFDSWEEFIHPEYEVAKKASLEKKQKGISLQDCLDEFTKEERLGEDDLWYCPRCKKHQQATKKFDLWNTPDILVVHLKRFSNSRTLRDKIDAFVDFPVEGLDLKDMVRERAVSKNLVEQGIEIKSLNLTGLDEPLVYDLFGVDEHMGGLGGGHYRAFALNHMNGQWYHFDDSFVNPANATDAVNANAYLLFYRRRTETPLGGKTHEIIQAARNKTERGSEIVPDDGRKEIPMAVDTQLPTPPEETPFRGGENNSMGHPLMAQQVSRLH
ncbi:hypothetical protein AX14_008914 [Amanita brunnescens Koide BX004]|nr:hypothetical protein AX14_008914 [Amanita brunnescens Koide BX004]